MNVRATFITSILLFFSFIVQAQEKGNFYIGIQPEITIEKEYAPGELDFNALPLVVQYHITDPIALRISMTMNVHAYQGLTLSHIGPQVSFPWYFLYKMESDLSGFYLAPLAGLSSNRRSGGLEGTIGAEPGYTWFMKSGFTMNLGMQLGGTYFSVTDDTGGWRNHFGFKFNLGYTFKKRAVD